MRIALADDHELFRAGLGSALKDAFGPGAEVLEASDRASLAKIIEAERDLDLVICDLRMPGMEDADCIAQLVCLNPAVPFAMVSASDDPADACRAIKQGAKGYILKSDSLAVLQHALELILAGGTYAPVQALISDTPAPCGQRRPLPALPALSNRQLMIFERLADGKSNKIIARELGIAEGTVKAQLRTVFRKLGVANRVQAALVAAEVLNASAVPAKADKPRASGGGTVEENVYPFPNQA
ncbi:response regulator transcription factor [Pelagibius sp.]|uniref:response regulator n=1 Tax=Pelagibius sp. TaxID=1931238 RepID=UPI00260F48D0|nr:response regulator transcription factor [Pelagibius sp.]